MLRGIFTLATKAYACAQSKHLIKNIATTAYLTCAPSDREIQLHNAIQSQTDSYLNILKNASDAKEVLEFMPILNRRKIDRHTVTLSALKALFELHKLGKTSIEGKDVLNHPRFAELCKALKYESRFFIMNDITECLKILTYFGVHSNSEIMTVLLQLVRHQINDVTLDHIVFLDFLLKKLERSPLVEALRLALPMLLQIQISYKMDHENVQQLVDLLSFISQHRVSDRCITNVVSALTLHGNNLSSQQAADALKALIEFKYFEPVHLKLLDNIFSILTKNINDINFKTIDFIMKKIADKNLEKFPMFYHEAYFKKCSQLIVNNDLGILNALYFTKKLNKIVYLHIPLLDYIGAHAGNLSIIPTSGIIALVAAFSNANYKPPNWDSIRAEIDRHSFITNPSIPWIRYALELLSLDILNTQLISQYLEPSTLEKRMERRTTVVDFLQLLELTQTLQLLYPEYDGPLPDQQYIERGIKLSSRDSWPLQKPLEFAFGVEGCVLPQVTSSYGHVLDHVIVFDQEGRPMNHWRHTGVNRSEWRIEDLLQGGNKLIVVLCLPKSYYALNVHRLRGRFAMHIRTIEAMGAVVVPISYHMWMNLPEAERIPFLEREVRSKLKTTYK